MILKGNFTGYNMKKKLSVKTLMGKVQNFFTPVKHKSRSYLEYCHTYKCKKEIYLESETYS